MPLRQLAEATKTNKLNARISHLKLHPVSSFATRISGLHTFGRNAPIKSKLQHPPPPRANPGHLTIFCAREWGIWPGKAFPGVGNLTLPGWGGENWTGSVRFQIAFSGGGGGGGAEVANSYKHVLWLCPAVNSERNKHCRMKNRFGLNCRISCHSNNILRSRLTN